MIIQIVIMKVILMVDKYNMILEQNMSLVKRNIIDYIWKSIQLEGLHLTFSETEAILSGHSPSTVNASDIVTINNLKQAWQFLLDTLNHPADFDLLCQINCFTEGNDLIHIPNLFAEHIEFGYTTLVLSPTAIENKLKKSISEINEIDCVTERAITMMLHCMFQQSFNGGNRLTSILFANHIMICNGCGVISVPIEKQAKFMSLLNRFCRTGNTIAIKRFIYNYCIDGMDFKKYYEESHLFN